MADLRVESLLELPALLEPAGRSVAGEEFRKQAEHLISTHHLFP